jgi:hypothetical protein
MSAPSLTDTNRQALRNNPAIIDIADYCCYIEPGRDRTCAENAKKHINVPVHKYNICWYVILLPIPK